MWLVVSLVLAGVDPRLLESALGSSQGVEWVRQLSDDVGARFAGTPAAQVAVEWTDKTLRGFGLTPQREATKVPRWIRGQATAELLLPTRHPLRVLALGGSVATPPEGVTADVLVVHSFEELEQRKSEAKGKIVVYQVTMPRAKDFSQYGAYYAYRAHGASTAAKYGAIAALVRSTGTGSHQLPHTGGMRYDDGVAQIPNGALSGEDADLIARLSERNPRVQLHLLLTPHVESEVDSASVIADLKGSDKASEIVLVGCHLDSWDIGRGALDDAAGCSMLLELARLVQRDKVKLRRTVRLVFFMNEEFGLSGAFTYGKKHAAELSKHVVAIEADAGAGRATGYAVTGDEASVAIVKKWMAPFTALVPLNVRTTDETGADLIPLHSGQVAMVGVSQDASDYFEWHHTAGDTFDKIVREDLAHATAALIALTVTAANDDVTLPRTKPESSH